ncbi:phospholipase effector Tle1 domain-containing protein [Flavobacterium sp. AJR]|uniref:phospholipase effector Tle1 domain-containing protein n=1 Tax=Flavobacterium sp. AJR TaxID=1979369 RepID=UPI000A3D803A|nr:DUF2235 domain-containing protein [Flavobacterium sp. AJR]OUL60271.1 hypothetical protein B8T70_21285 [Flavobacterium sp. AJR]
MGKSFVYNTGTSEDVIPKKYEELTFGLFFDGTLNNLENTKLRKKYRDEGFMNNEKKDDYTFDEAGEKARKSARDAEDDNYSDSSGFSDEKRKYLEAAHRNGIMDIFTKGAKALDKMGVDNSFGNDYTNVARMSLCCKNDYKIYIEGMGTNDNARDVDQGFQYGSGNTGIRAKVRKACELLAKKIKKVSDDDGNKIVTQVTVDVFGFSRGAASARNFVYEITEKAPLVLVKTGEYDEDKIFKDSSKIRESRKQQDVIDKPRYVEFGRDSGIPAMPSGGLKALPKKNMKPIYGKGDSDGKPVDPSLIKNGKMPEMGHLGYSLLKLGLKPELLDELRIIVRFVGLYDTVSSYEEDGDGTLKEEDGGTLLKGAGHLYKSKFKDDVLQLQLNKLDAAQKIVHFTAKDEHRENFDLTRVPQNGCVIEKNLPGVHCDIGGAYENGEEVVDELETTNHFDPNIFLNFKGYLIKNYWYKEEQLSEGWGFLYNKLTGTRMLRKEYSYIPLHFMEVFFKELTEERHMSRSVVGDYPINNDGILEDTKTHLEKYVFNKGGVEWEFIDDEKVKLIETNEKIDKRIKEGRLNELEQEPRYDNLNPNDYKPKIRLDLEKIPGLATEPADKWEGLSDQTLLRILRNGYFHWSANKDWLGMDPTDSRIREEH